MKKGPGRATAILVDGNSVAAVAVERADHGGRVIALHHHESDELFEVTKRVRHPVFMDADIRAYRDKACMQSVVDGIFENEDFRNPTVILYQPDRLQFEEMYGGESDPTARRAALFGRMPQNPINYPCIFTFQEIFDDGQPVTVLGTARIADYLPLLRMVESAGAEIMGCLPARSCARRVMEEMKIATPPEPVVLCDIGKLRTLYSSASPAGAYIHNAIPVGLARDDMHYFGTFVPTVAALEQLDFQIGTLFLSVYDTKTGLFASDAEDPQVECTRFAEQISRYAERTCQRASRNGSTSGRICLSGRGSRIPGIDKFMFRRLHMPVGRVRQQAFPGIDVPPEIAWEDVADNLLLVGAAMDALNPMQVSIRPIASRYSNPPIADGAFDFSAMENEATYVLERKPE